jgi:hypothetical protein
LINLNDLKGHSALSLLETYSGINPYLLRLKHEYLKNGKIILTDTQSKYIIENHEREPLLVNRVIGITKYLGEELQKIESTKPKPINKDERLVNFKKLLLYAKETSKKENYIDAGDIVYGFIRNSKLVAIPKHVQNDALEYGKKRFSDEKKKRYMEATIKHHSYKTLSDLNFEEEDKVKKYAREYVVNLWLKEVDIQPIVDKLTYQMIDY